MCSEGGPVNEADWLAGTDATRLLSAVNHHRPDDRVYRLFACACCRAIWPLIIDPISRQAVEVAERFADGAASEADLQAAWGEANRIALMYWEAVSRERGETGEVDSAGDHIFGATDDEGDAYSHAATAAASTTLGTAAMAARDALVAVREAEFLADRVSVALPAGPSHADRLRDIAGSPFRSPVRGPALGPTGRAVAEVIRDERRFADLPILADALEDDGWTDGELLAHLRGPGPHFHGCWALAFVLSR
jgi:hypothetical protein